MTALCGPGPNSEILDRIYEKIGVPDDGPTNRGRRQKIAEALGAVWPDIVAQVAHTIADAMDDEDIKWGAYIDGDWVRQSFGPDPIPPPGRSLLESIHRGKFDAPDGERIPGEFLE